MEQNMSEGLSDPSLAEHRLHAIEHAFNELEGRLTESCKALHSSLSPETALEVATSSLKAVLGFLEVSPRMYRQTDPLLRLYADLRSLQKGSRPPMLNPKWRDKRPPAPLLYHALKGVTVFTINRIMGLGLSRADARIAVAKILNQRGVTAAG